MLSLRKMWLFIICAFLSSLLFGGYSDDNNKGERLTPKERARVNAAIDILRKANKKEWKSIVEGLQKLLDNNQINKETAKDIFGETKKDVNPKTKKASYKATKGDRINIGGPILAESPETNLLVLAATLAHEGRHAKEATMDWAIQEKNAYEFSSDVLDYLLNNLDQLVGDPDARDMTRVKLEILKEENDKRKEKLRVLTGEAFGDLFLLAWSTAYAHDQRLSFTITSDSRVLLVTDLDNRVSQEISIYYIDRPLNVGIARLFGRDFLVVTGTYYEDRYGVVQLYRLFKDDKGMIIPPYIYHYPFFAFFQYDVHPTFFTVDEDQSHIYLYDALNRKILQLIPYYYFYFTPLTIANITNFKQIKDIKNLWYSHEKRVLTASIIPFWADSQHDNDIRFELIDLDGDFKVDFVREKTMRELTYFEPSFSIDPFSGEDEVFISASFGSEVVLQTDTGEILGTAEVEYEEPTEMQLERELREGEIVTLIDKTRNLTSLPQKIEEPRPTAVDIIPEFAQAGIQVPVKIIGKYFAPDSKVFVDGRQAIMKKVTPAEITCILPAVSKEDVSPHKPMFVDVEITSAIAPSTSVEFTYLDMYDFRKAVEEQGRKVQKH